MAEYPLWWCLSVATQAFLMRYQWENYGEKLKVVLSPMAPGVSVHARVEPLDEIERIMGKAPHSPRRSRD